MRRQQPRSLRIAEIFVARLLLPVQQFNLIQLANRFRGINIELLHDNLCSHSFVAANKLNRPIRLLKPKSQYPWMFFDKRAGVLKSSFLIEQAAIANDKTARVVKITGGYYFSFLFHRIPLTYQPIVIFIGVQTGFNDTALRERLPYFPLRENP